MHSFNRSGSNGVVLSCKPSRNVTLSRCPSAKNNRPSFHTCLPRTAGDDTDCLFGKYQTPQTEPYTDDSHDGRDSQTRLALGRLVAHNTCRRGTACIAQSPAGALEQQTIPPSALLCQCLGHARRSSPVHSARARWKLQACLRGRACTLCLTFLVHVPGVTSIFTFMSMSNMGSCRVMSAEVNGLAVVHDGMA